MPALNSGPESAEGLGALARAIHTDRVTTRMSYPALPYESSGGSAINGGRRTSDVQPCRLMVGGAIPCEQAGLTGTLFLEATKSLTRAAREQAIFDAIAGGSIPSSMQTFADVALGHGGHSGIVRVAVDYASIGTDEDFVRIPMSPITAQRLADQLGYVLPTKRLVDAIYGAAIVKLQPSPLPAGPQMMSNDYYRRHHEAVEKQLAGRGTRALIAGHKKDVVVSKRLVQRPDRVAIYGWHRPDGRPIQPLSLVHEATYADYSHGVRWVLPRMVVDGVERPITEVLRDSELAPLLSDEGVLLSIRAAVPLF